MRARREIEYHYEIISGPAKGRWKPTGSGNYCRRSELIKGPQILTRPRKSRFPRNQIRGTETLSSLNKLKANGMCNSCTAEGIILSRWGIDCVCQMSEILFGSATAN
ncbi:hypothetical protein GWI33_005784 [Rhynchophorus ferrugineus]|uniref:Uncharacterized protein n=1 Tax=Rhynchophorus ferrugineus TaxID=354439 RepID=A0A834IYS4_RHYFE|nr:hypothetical protein GWI33_005784 [Rhynchophorus ferrugineus]